MLYINFFCQNSINGFSFLRSYILTNVEKNTLLDSIKVPNPTFKLIVVLLKLQLTYTTNNNEKLLIKFYMNNFNCVDKTFL